jgi:hypothetical protein
MQDRPTILELLAAVRDFVTRHVVPALDGRRQFHARVAANVLAIVERELRDGDAQLREEWMSLRSLCMPVAEASGAAADLSGAHAPPPDDDVPPANPATLRAAVAALNADLAARIRSGDADRGPFRDAVHRHLRTTIDDKLRIANPAYLEEESR